MKKAIPLIVVGLLHCVMILGCHAEKNKNSLHSDSPRQYKHNFYSSDEECRRIIGPASTKTCGETMHFDTSGKLSALLGGSALMLAGNYQIQGDSLVATLPDDRVQPLKIYFKTPSSTELLRIDNNTIWTAY